MPRKRLAQRQAVTAAAARKILTNTVTSPYSNGIHRPSPMIDSLESMFRRKQIGPHQKRAADNYRDAFDGLTSTGRSMDFDKVRAGTPGAQPAPTAPLAAETIAGASKLLGRVDGDIVELIVGRGYTIEQAAARVFSKAVKKKLSECDVDCVGKRLRDALTMLADEWHPVSEGKRIQAHVWRTQQGTLQPDQQGSASASEAEPLIGYS